MRRSTKAALGTDHAGWRIADNAIDQPQNANFGNAVIGANLDGLMGGQTRIAFDAEIDQPGDGFRIQRQSLVQNL